MPHPKDDPKNPEWRPYIFARDQWHCRICGDRFLYSEMVRKHIADAHDENMPPSMYEYFSGAFLAAKENTMILPPTDQWHCRICGDRFLYSEMVRKQIGRASCREMG